MEDFFNLCKQNELNFIPLVVSRNKLPNSPTQIDFKEKPRLTKKASEMSQSVNQSSLQYESSLSALKPQLSYENTNLDGGKACKNFKLPQMKPQMI
jgi:hypothetical protein